MVRDLEWLLGEWRGFVVRDSCMGTVNIQDLEIQGRVLWGTVLLFYVIAWALMCPAR